MSEGAPPFTIAYDNQTQILHLTLVGLWGMPTFSAFAASLMLKTTLLKMQRKPYDVLSDSRSFAVQTGAVAAGFERIAARSRQSPVGAVGYMAIVVASELNLLQVQQSMHHDRLQAFLDIDEARAWLVSRRAAKSGG